MQDPPEPLPDPPLASQPAHPTPGQVIHPPQSDPLPGVGNFQRLPSIDESKDVVVVTRKKPYWQAGTFDPVLSNACALGDFVTAEFNRMIARFVDPAGQGSAGLQVVVPTHRHLLYDRRNLAKPNETYFFKDSNRPNCKVWIEGKVRPRAINPARGTSLPKTPANDVKKKLKTISTWPKK